MTPPPNAVSATALVTSTEEPIENFYPSIAGTYGSTQILVDAGAGPVVGYQGLPLDPDHWLTVGMSVPVFIDSAKPNEYVVDWTKVPSIDDRVAAKEASLADPFAAQLRAWDALAAAGYHEPDLDDVAPQLMKSEMEGMRAQLAGAPDALAHQLAGVASLSAPDGYQRALVVIATASVLWGEGRGLTEMTHFPHRVLEGKHSVVLSVHIPGSGAYPVLVRKFDREDRQHDPNNPGLAAVVSISDPTDVRVLWKEIPKWSAPAPSAATTAAAIASIDATPPPASASTATPEMRAILSAQANAMLARMPAAARPATIAYYKAMGADIDPSLIP